jgi:predicted  nucleic acid-binding Zn-ribbon protein
MNPRHAIIILLLCILLGESLFCSWLYSQYASLQQENTALKLKYETLSNQFSALNSSYYTLVSDFNKLSNEFAVLNETYMEMVARYSDVSQRYTDTLLQYNALEKNFGELNRTHASTVEAFFELSANYSTLQNNYNQLNMEYQNTVQTYLLFVEAYAQLVKEVNLHSLHPTSDETKLITFSNDAVVAKMLEITGGWANKTDWNEFWQDVFLMYQWVKNNIQYRSDGDYPILPDQPNGTLINWPEMWQYPTETLGLKKGDCEDMAILLTSLILAYSNETIWTEVIVITQHAAVYIPVSPGQICILDASGSYYTNTGSPSYTITYKDINQEVNNWLNYWNSHGISNPRVDWVFSSYLWQEFYNTSTFTTWLYDRTQ